MKCKVFPKIQFQIVNLLKLQNKICIVATIDQKLLQEIDDVLFISNGCIGFRTRTKSSNNEEKLKFLAKHDINVSQSLIL